MDHALAELDTEVGRSSDAETVVKTWVEQKDVRRLCKLFLNADPRHSPHDPEALKRPHMQEDIIRSIAFPSHENFIMNCHTQYGKTHGAAQGMALALVLESEPTRNVNMAPQLSQSYRFRDTFGSLIAGSRFLQGMVNLDRRRSHDSLQREFSKRRITFETDSELLNITLGGQGMASMGESADRTVHDEASLTAPEVYGRINRMHTQSVEPLRIEMANPWHQNNAYHGHWLEAQQERMEGDEKWGHIHVPWPVGVREGRVRGKHIENERRELTPLFFQVLYDSVFPDQAENQAIPYSHIVRAERTGTTVEALYEEAGIDFEEAHVAWGLDIAEAGSDYTVLTKRYMHDDLDVMEKQWRWQHADTMQTADHVHTVVPIGDSMVGDANGIGKGVCDRLQSLGHALNALKSQQKARMNHQYANAGSECIDALRKDLEEERLLLLNPSQSLKQDLTKWRILTRSGRMAFEVEGGREGGNSPDDGDSLAFSGYRSRMSFGRLSTRQEVVRRAAVQEQEERSGERGRGRHVVTREERLELRRREREARKRESGG